MANQSFPEAIDPHSVPETLCLGRFNISIVGDLATLTFTHERPDATALFEGRVDVKAVVRARIVTTVANLHEFCDLLIRLTQSSEPPAAASGGATRH